MDFPLGIVVAAAVAATFTQAAAANAAHTFASIKLNSGNLLEKLVLWHIEFGGYEVISRLRISNADKDRYDFKSLEYVRELRVMYPPE